MASRILNIDANFTFHPLRVSHPTSLLSSPPTPQQQNRLSGGTGLGLYALRKRVEALHGTCGVANRKNGKSGAIFWFMFKYRPDHTMERFYVAKRRSNELSSGQRSGEGLGQGSGLCAGKGQGSGKGLDMRRDGAAWDSDAEDEAAMEGMPTVVPSVLREIQSPTHPSTHPSTLPFVRYTTTSNPDLVPDSTHPTGRPLRALVVDDTATVLKIARRTLGLAGYEVETAENGLEALEKLKAVALSGVVGGRGLTYDVVVMDLQMPIMGE